ncbi:hypothetical protein CC1G_04776 [Coprinopsis cinerea okayama7|uniref:Uncharacterized protein n=1 Tax=Coprinopsis cinerea (strain Okayama-7 / 130 / ATCC MYA-4618 / FGSC 9003) TaxID=240176 RepID=A8P2I9_COPC7|nr:hypothetical protein CC1G_04776 [Coprinopsis cinerea okayama7\|eukprot:XP_001838332.2 hypothetical protein CC1G_04776 [Coprinopsis cinerea okayama7\
MMPSTTDSDRVCSPVEEVSESQEREDDSSQPSASSSSESQAMMRASSLAPTEIDDPDADQLATLLTSHNIKIRDYAYVPSTRPPVAELFDQYEGIAEYEYRLRQRPRLYPITGKVLRRLLDIGWVTMDEVNSRCHAMDFEELRKADERPGGPYPYIVRWKEGEYIAGGILVAAPNSERQRVQVMEARREKWMRLDRVRRRMELEMESERVERERAEEVLRARRLQLRREMMERRKRSLGDIEEDSSSGPKRRKVEGDEVAEEEEFVESQNDYNVPDDFMDDAEEPALGSQQEPEPWTREYWDKQPGMAAFKPEKQYPAPLSEYDPEIYPEARSIIESQEQSQQRRGALLHHSPSPGPSSSPFAPSSSSPGAGPSTRPLQPAGTQPLVRTDTPPLEESQPSQPQHQMGPGLGKPNRGLKRTLSRTQTFSQL